MCIRDSSKIEASFNLIKSKARAYEFKTTFVPGFLTKEDIVEIAEWLQGAEVYFLQQFKPLKPLVSSQLESTVPYLREYVYETLEAIRPFFKRCAVRGV